jgi:CheY-like chemotaxis protein
MKKILIMEDDPLITRIARRKDETAGFAGDAAPDGEAGLERSSSSQLRISPATTCVRTRAATRGFPCGPLAQRRQSM